MAENEIEGALGAAGITRRENRNAYDLAAERIGEVIQAAGSLWSKAPWAPAYIHVDAERNGANIDVTRVVLLDVERAIICANPIEKFSILFCSITSPTSLLVEKKKQEATLNVVLEFADGRGKFSLDAEGPYAVDRLENAVRDHLLPLLTRG